MPTGPVYQVGVELAYDNTQLKTGVTESETALRGLETVADQTATEMSTSFDQVATDVPAAFSNTSVGITDSAKKLKGVGKQVGADVALAVTDGFSSGNVVGSITSVIGSLAAVGGIAAVGVGIGGALVTGLVEGWQKSKAEFTEAVNGLLGSVEDDFRGTWESIRKDMFQEFSKIGTLEELGGEGGLTEGLRQANVFTDQLGLGLGRVTDVLRGKTDPATDRVVANLRKMSEETEDVYKAGVKVGEVETARAKKAQELLGLFEAQRGQLKQARDDAADLYDLQHDAVGDARAMSDAQAYAADAAERQAAALERAATQASQVASRLASIPLDYYKGLL